MSFETIADVGLRRASAPTWSRHDTTWVLGLFATAIGAGSLFLPINAGIGGIWPLLIMAVLAFPMTYLAHRGLIRFVLSSSKPGSDITEVVGEHFGVTAGKLITLLYFFTILPILLLYGVGLTNTVEALMINQIGMAPPPRALLALVLTAGLFAVVMLGERMVVQVMGWMVYPFIAVLIGFALYLVPQWNGAVFHDASPANFSLTLWLSIPVLVFSFNHSPVISRFAVAQHELIAASAVHRRRGGWWRPLAEAVDADEVDATLELLQLQPRAHDLAGSLPEGQRKLLDERAASALASAGIGRVQVTLAGTILNDVEFRRSSRYRIGYGYYYDYAR